jgi:hypothetical protein
VAGGFLSQDSSGAALITALVVFRGVVSSLKGLSLDSFLFPRTYVRGLLLASLRDFLNLVCPEIWIAGKPRLRALVVSPR